MRTLGSIPDQGTKIPYDMGCGQKFFFNCNDLEYQKTWDFMRVPCDFVFSHSFVFLLVLPTSWLINSVFQ